MSGEDMVKALGHIDEKYIEEAESARLSGGKIWLRVGSLAACLCVLLAGLYGMWIMERGQSMDASGEVLSGGTVESMQIQQSQESADEPKEPAGAVPAQGQHIPDTREIVARYIRTDGGSEDTTYPFVSVLRSREELESYCTAQENLFDLGSEFLEARTVYGSSYFSQRDLVLICLEEQSGSVRHEVTDIRKENGGWVITVARDLPEEGTCDMAQWHILVEMPAHQRIAPEEKISVRLVDKEN